MSLAAKLRNPPPRVKGPRCTVAVILDTLTGDDLDALTDALTETHADEYVVSSVYIAELLTAEGYKVGRNTVQRHRRGECSCP